MQNPVPPPWGCLATVTLKGHVQDIWGGAHFNLTPGSPHSEAPSFSPQAAPGSSPLPSELDGLKGRRGEAVEKDLQARGYQPSATSLCLPTTLNSRPRQNLALSLALNLAIPCSPLPLGLQELPISEGSHLPHGVHFQDFQLQVLPWEAERRGGLALALEPWLSIHGAT